MRLRNWRERLDVARVSIVSAGRQAMNTAHRVAVQGAARAKLQGERLARHITGIQKAVRAPDKMIRESVRSVAAKPMALTSDQAWQAAYVRTAVAQMPGLVPEYEPAPKPPAPERPERPAWPFTAGPIDPTLFRSAAEPARTPPGHAPEMRDDREAGQ